MDQSKIDRVLADYSSKLVTVTRVDMRNSTSEQRRFKVIKDIEGVYKFAKYETKRGKVIDHQKTRAAIVYIKKAVRSKKEFEEPDAISDAAILAAHDAYEWMHARKLQPSLAFLFNAGPISFRRTKEDDQIAALIFLASQNLIIFHEEISSTRRKVKILIEIIGD